MRHEIENSIYVTSFIARNKFSRITEKAYEKAQIEEHAVDIIFAKPKVDVEDETQKKIAKEKELESSLLKSKPKIVNVYITNTEKNFEPFC